jgi:hypothetical protein
MMKYPIGIQDFGGLRRDGYVYVDKTKHIHRIINSGKYYFLSRPRRFGKSLTLSTMKELYSGRADLFKGLWIEDKWDFKAMERPVIWLKFAKLDYHSKGLEAALNEEIVAIGKEFGLTLSHNNLKNNFSKLIQLVGSEDKRAVLLIDEYDKPIIDYLDDLEQVDTNRAILKRFYSVIKDSDPYLDFVFITGVSAFSKVSIFSDLNNISDISLDRLAVDLVGITQQELESYFAEEMQEIDADLLKRWYNGYSWNGKTTLYNPFSLLSFLRSRQYHNFWYATGTPTFLIKEMKKQRYYDIGQVEASQMGLSSFNVERLNPVTVLFQTGYLTIVDNSEGFGFYTLSYPNIEVKQSLQRHLLELYLDYPLHEPGLRVLKLKGMLERNDLAGVVTIINTLFAELPFDHWRRDDEHLFHAIVHLIFSLLGVIIQSEVHTARGRCDAIVKTDQYIYAFEFKRDGTAPAALQQIEERAYLSPYADDAREKIAVGINFSSETKQVVEWETVSSAG